jgi:hypothetical protein
MFIVQYKKKKGKQVTWASFDLCTLQLSPLCHREEGNEEGSRNMYLWMV